VPQPLTGRPWRVGDRHAGRALEAGRRAGVPDRHRTRRSDRTAGACQSRGPPVSLCAACQV